MTSISIGGTTTSILVGTGFTFSMTLIGMCLIDPWSFPRSRWLRQTLKPGMRGAQQIDRLINLLGSIDFWLGSNGTRLVDEIRKNLWRQCICLEMEKLAYHATYSPKIDEQRWALKRLSQYKKAKAKKAIRAVSTNPAASEQVRTLAEDLLNRMEKSKKISKNPDMVIKVEGINTMSGDIYNVGQAGAVGPEAHAHDMTFTQMGGQLFDSIDLADLADELSALRLEMQKTAKGPEDSIAIGAIASAELEAKKGNKAKVIEYLSQAGKWALDVATKIGVALATAAIKESLGMK